MRSVRAGVRQSVVFLAGLLAGTWVVIAPWVIGYPQPDGGRWTSSEWSDVVVGAVVVAVSAAGLVAAVTHALQTLVRQVESGRSRSGDGAPDRRRLGGEA